MAGDLEHAAAQRLVERYFAWILSQVFGGSFSSRLNKAIRVDQGLTY
jgi:predicted Zn-dependent peptidase